MAVRLPWPRHPLRLLIRRRWRRIFLGIKARLSLRRHPQSGGAAASPCRRCRLIPRVSDRYPSGKGRIGKLFSGGSPGLLMSLRPDSSQDVGCRSSWPSCSGGQGWLHGGSEAACFLRRRCLDSRRGSRRDVASVFRLDVGSWEAGDAPTVLHPAVRRWRTGASLRNLHGGQRC